MPGVAFVLSISTIQTALFPSPPPPSLALSVTAVYIKHTTSRITAEYAAQQKRRAKSRSKTKSTSTEAPADGLSVLTLHVATAWPAWQAKYLTLARQHFDGTRLDIKALSQGMDKIQMKRAMPFLQEVKKQLEGGGDPGEVFERKLVFDEVGVLREMVPLVKRTVPGLKEVKIVVVEGEDGMGAEPGAPRIEFGCK